MKETGRKAEVNVPLDWSLNQILYSYDEELNKSDIVAAAVRSNKGKVSSTYISKKLTKEYPDMDKAEILKPELTKSGRRALLHVNIPVELRDEAERIAEESMVSFNKAIHCMLHKLYDSNTVVTPVPRARRADINESVRIAINFPVALVQKVGGLSSTTDFRQTVIKATEEYVRRNEVDGRGNSSEGLGT